MDGAGGRVQHALDGGHAEAGLDAEIGSDDCQLAVALVPVLGDLLIGIDRRLPLGTAQAGAPPILIGMHFLP